MDSVYPIKLKLRKVKVVVRTERLRLAVIDGNDAPFILELLNSPNWLTQIGDRKIKDLSSATDYIRSYILEGYQKNGYGQYKMVLKNSNITIGICGFVKREYLDHPDIGFAVLPKYEGQGYAFEATIAVLEYGLDNLGLSNVYGYTTEGNQKAKYLLQRIGLSYKGQLIDPAHKEFLLYEYNPGN